MPGVDALESRRTLQASVSTTARFGELLRRHRLAAGLTQRELAQRAGLSLRAVNALERGDRQAPHQRTITRLADALYVAPDDRAALEATSRQRTPAARDERACHPAAAGAAATQPAAAAHPTAWARARSGGADRAGAGRGNTAHHPHRAGGVGKIRLAVFADGWTVVLGTASLSAGGTSFSTTSLKPGAHTITAVYSGDGSFLGSTSAPYTLYVNTNLSSFPKLATGGPCAYNLSNANLSGGYFVGLCLQGASLTGANLSGANLSNSNLTGATGLNTATLTGIIWNKTECPDGTFSNYDGGTCVGHL